MAFSSPFILRLLASSVSAATRAGKIIRDIMASGELGIVEKAKNDLQTEADRSAQKCIVASLTQQFPDLVIIGEEGASSCEVPSDWIVTDSDPSILRLDCPKEYENMTNSDVVIWVDPLDGTSEYTQGFLENVTVLIGIAVKGTSVAGVIHQPYFNYKSSNNDSMGRTLWGLVGAGVGGFEPRPPPPNGLILATTRSHSDDLVESAIKSLDPTEILRTGGAGYKVVLLMEGKAHAYVHASKGCKKWDSCAVEAILKTTGGKLTDVRGKEYCYDKDVEHPNSGGIFATAGGVNHEELIKRIPDELKDMLY